MLLALLTKLQVKKLRKVKKGARKKKRKEAQQKLADQASRVMNHPTECCVCREPFERTHTSVQEWMITMREERLRLTCPTCWRTVMNIAEEAANEGY